MKKERYLRFYNVHSWSGIILGLFIYTIAFAGCLALFYNELQTWEDPAKRISVAKERVLIMPIFEAWVVSNSSEQRIENVKFYYPKEHEPYFKAIMLTANKDNQKLSHEARWNTHNGDELVTKSSGLSDWLRDFHRHLMWPMKYGGERFGRFLVGIAGITLMLSIISGIIVHTKIITQMFVLRTERSQLLKWQDLHKAFGFWPLPFHLMVAFTGAFLGVISLLSPIMAVLAFKGDTEALIAAVFGNQKKAVGIDAPMLSLDQLGKIRLESSGQFPTDITIRNWGDQNATYKVSFPTKNELASYDSQTLSAVSGELIDEELTAQIPLSKRVTNTVSPLHYGNYGNIWLKIIYLILGLTLCVVTVSGLMIWLKRRLNINKDDASIVKYKKIGRLIVGVTLGLPIASFAVFHLDKLYFGTEVTRMRSIGIFYFTVWSAVIIFSYIGSQQYKTIKALFFTLAVLTITIPLTNYLSTGDVFWSQLNSSKTWVWVDATCFILGVVITFVTAFFREQRLNRFSSLDY